MYKRMTLLQSWEQAPLTSVPPLVFACQMFAPQVFLPNSWCHHWTKQIFVKTFITKLGQKITFIFISSSLNFSFSISLSSLFAKFLVISSALSWSNSKDAWRFFNITSHSEVSLSFSAFNYKLSSFNFLVLNSNFSVQHTWEVKRNFCCNFQSSSSSTTLVILAVSFMSSVTRRWYFWDRVELPVTKIQAIMYIRTIHSASN